MLVSLLGCHISPVSNLLKKLERFSFVGLDNGNQRVISFCSCIDNRIIILKLILLYLIVSLKHCTWNIGVSLIDCFIIPSLFHRPSSKGAERVQDVVTESDLDHLVNLIGGRDGETEWQSLMEKTTPTMAYKAWRHDPEVDSEFDLYCFLENIISVLHLLITFILFTKKLWMGDVYFVHLILHLFSCDPQLTSLCSSCMILP